MRAPVLVTGATGFVGRQVVRALADRGSGVRAVVREGRQGDVEGLEGVETAIGTPDLFAESSHWWARVCDGIDTVIHLAWYVEPGRYLCSEKNLDCLAGTLELAKGAALAKTRRFVGIGTCFEYDVSAGMLSTRTPLRPLTPYAAAKAAAFMVLSQWLLCEGVEFAWCRPFYLYGDGEDERRLVPYIRSRLAASQPVELTMGTQIRDFLDVEVAGQMIADVAFSDVSGAVNICSGVPQTVRELAERIADEYGGRDLLRFGLRPTNLMDPPCVVGVKDPP